VGDNTTLDDNTVGFSSCRLGPLVRGAAPYVHPALSIRLEKGAPEACDRVMLQSQQGKRHGRAVGPRPPPRVRRRRRVGVAHRQPLVEEGHDHLLRVGRELLEERRRVRVGRLEEHLCGGAHAVGRLRRQGL